MKWWYSIFVLIGVLLGWWLFWGHGIENINYQIDRVVKPTPTTNIWICDFAGWKRMEGEKFFVRKVGKDGVSADFCGECVCNNKAVDCSALDCNLIINDSNVQEYN